MSLHLTPDDVRQLFAETISTSDQGHMLCYFANAGRHPQATLPPFLVGLCRALSRIDRVSPGLALKFLKTISSIKGIGEDQFEQILQVLSEVYVFEGAAAVADIDPQGGFLFDHEPGSSSGKNPELASSAGGIRYSVEVKAPRLLKQAASRNSNSYQINQRFPFPPQIREQSTLPRDNPVKDFLLSAQAKFEHLKSISSTDFNILIIVWDDFAFEAISALKGPASGLLTPNSFSKNADGDALTYPDIDGVAVCRYQHQIARSTQLLPLGDGETIPFEFHHTGYPPKAFIQNPFGRKVPDELLRRLGLTPVEQCHGAEYHTPEIVLWIDPAISHPAKEKPQD